MVAPPVQRYGVDEVVVAGLHAGEINCRKTWTSCNGKSSSCPRRCCCASANWRRCARRRSHCRNSAVDRNVNVRSEEHTSELQSLMRISYAVFCLKKKKHNVNIKHN